MFSAALERFERVNTSDMDVARDAVTAVVKPHAFHARAVDGVNPRVVVRAAPLGHSNVIVLRYDVDADINPGAFEDCYLAMFAQGGPCALEQPDRVTVSQNGLGWITSPGPQTRVRIKCSSDQLLYRVERTRVDQLVAAMIDRSLKKPICFNPLIDPTRTQGRLFWLGLQNALEQLSLDGHAAAHPLFRQQIEQSLLYALILGQPSNYLDALHAPIASAAPRSVKRAEDYVRSHVDEPITLLDMAQAAGVSPRALQEAFKRFRGTSPMQYLRDQRLDHVQADLAGRAQGETVTNIAYKWGFTQLGRFARDYRRRFGEAPSQTLKRQ
jgi:AraC-like DNA-binding protein